MSRRSMGIKNWILLLCLAVAFACSKGPDAIPEAKTSGSDFTLAERDKAEAPSAGLFAEGSGSKVETHPDIKGGEKVERQVRVPQNVQGQWKAVKILVKDKTNEENNVFETVDLGSSFFIGDTKIKVTVGPFFPNFVMDQGTYTSMNNELINPAVQLVVEENGKVLYKGWTFAKYPTMYAFEHEGYALELSDYIAAEVS